MYHLVFRNYLKIICCLSLLFILQIVFFSHIKDAVYLYLHNFPFE